MRRTMSTAWAVVIALSATPAAAWGPIGHRTIAKIAADNIDGKTQAAIKEILGAEDLPEASTWPDEEKFAADPMWKVAGSWHYVTVPRGKTVNDVVHPAEGDALTELPKWTATLRDSKASKADKVKALRFMVHVVGDLHQPLHAYLPEDNGGQNYHVTWFGEPESLHWVWDQRIVTRQELSFTEFAARLEAHTTPDQVREWWNVDPKVWIAEDIAIRDTIYPKTDTASGNGSKEAPVALSFPYYWQWTPAANRRIQMAGIRLAAYLDWVFAGRWAPQ